MFMNPSMKNLLGVPEGTEVATIGVKMTEIPTVQNARNGFPGWKKLQQMENISFEVPFLSLLRPNLPFMSVKGSPPDTSRRIHGAIFVIADVSDKKKERTGSF